MAIALADIEAAGRTIGGRVWHVPMLTIAVAIPLSSGQEEIAPLYLLHSFRSVNGPRRLQV